MAMLVRPQIEILSDSENFLTEGVLRNTGWSMGGPCLSGLHTLLRRPPH